MSAAAIEQPQRRHLPVITTSEIRTFSRCRREHHFAYRLRRRSHERAHALRFGTLMHAALEAWWQNMDPLDIELDPLGAALGALAANPEAREIDAFDAVRAEVLIKAYHARWIDEPLRARAVEAEFTAPIVNPDTGAVSRTFVLGGKLDVVAEHIEMRRVYVVEHKTASSDIRLGSTYWKRLRLDSQVSNYFAGARTLALESYACVYDVIGKPGERPRKATPEADWTIVGESAEARALVCGKGKAWAKWGDVPQDEKVRLWRERPDLYRLASGQREFDETPEEYGQRIAEVIGEDPDAHLVRGEVVRLGEEETDAARDLWQVAREMREAELAGRFPRNPDACVRFNRTCEYFEVCTGEASIDDDTRFRTADSAHEELSQ